MAQARSVTTSNRTRELKAVPRQPVRTYLVPMVCKTIDIVELLSRERDGLQIEDIHRITGFAKSSIYRIVRTLVSKGYVEHCASGRYHISPNSRSDAGESRDRRPLLISRAQERPEERPDIFPY